MDDSDMKELSQAVEDNDPFSPTPYDDEEEARLNADDYHSRPRIPSVDREPNMEVVVKYEEPEPEKYYVYANWCEEAVVSKGSNGGTQRAAMLWKPMPRLNTTTGPYESKESAVDAAFSMAKSLIKNGTRDERRRSMEYIVSGPWKLSKVQFMDLLVKHCKTPQIDPRDKSKLRSGDLSDTGYKKLMLKYRRPNLFIVARVSTRVYNKDTLEPQVSYQSLGGLASNSFAERFPGGVVPYQAIMDSMTGPSGQAMIQELKEAGFKVTGSEMEAAKEHMHKLLKENEAAAGAAEAEEEVFAMEI